MEPKTNAPKLIVNVALLAEGKALLVKYRNRPDHQRGWFVPHGVLAQGEDPGVAAARLLKMQVNLEGGAPALSHIESFTGNDGSWHLPIHFGLKLSEVPPVVAGPTIERAEWFDLTALPERAEVAHHGWALDILEVVCASGRG